MTAHHCPRCGSTEISVRAYLDANTKAVLYIDEEGDNAYACEDHDTVCDWTGDEPCVHDKKICQCGTPQGDEP